MRNNKKIKTLIMLLMALLCISLLTACEKPETLNVGGDSKSDKVEAETEDTATLENVVCDSGNVFTIWSDGRIEKIDVKLPVNATLESVCSAEGVILVNYYENNSSDTTNYVVARCDLQGETAEIFSQKDIYSSGLVTVNDTAYYNYYYYDLESNTKYVSLKYDSNEGVMVDSPETAGNGSATEIDGYYNACYNLSDTLALDLYGYIPMTSYENNVLSFVDKDSNIVYTLPVEDAVFLDLKGDDLYYYVIADASSVDSGYEVHARNIKSDEDRLLYTTENANGSFRAFFPGIAGFSIVSDYAYFIIAEDTADVWYKINLAEAGAKMESTGYTAKEYDFLKMGKIEKESGSFKTEKTDKTFYSYHLEKFVANDSIKNADAINAELDAALKTAVDEVAVDAENNREFYEEEATEDSGLPPSSNDLRLSEVKLLGDRYLQVSYSGYLYYGGAHGSPYTQHFIFDTETGKKVTIKDIYQGKEEEFNKIALDVMVESIQSGSDEGLLYEEYYSMSEDELRKSLAEYININTSGFFTDECYVIENDPYALGCYASGYIYTDIPLEKLGIKF